MVELFLPRSFIPQEVTVCAVCSLGLEEGKRAICFCVVHLPAGSCGFPFFVFGECLFGSSASYPPLFRERDNPDLLKKGEGAVWIRTLGKCSESEKAGKTKTIIGAYGCRAASEQSHFGKKKPSEAFERLQNRQEDFP